MIYLSLKALHLVGVVSWFAGLFYHVRLFVYHAEALQLAEPRRSILARQYELMESRLFTIIMNPAMGITVATAAGMLALPEGRGWAAQPWMLAKYALVGLLVAYHFYTRGVMLAFPRGEVRHGGEFFRKLNEVPTLILIAVTILAVFKTAVSWVGLGVALGLAGVAIVVGYRAYQVHRLKEDAALAAATQGLSQ